MFFAIGVEAERFLHWRYQRCRRFLQKLAQLQVDLLILDHALPAFARYFSHCIFLSQEKPSLMHLLCVSLFSSAAAQWCKVKISVKNFDSKYLNFELKITLKKENWDFQNIEFFNIFGEFASLWLRASLHAFSHHGIYRMRSMNVIQTYCLIW